MVAKDPQRWCDKLKSQFQLKVVEEPRYYLGSDYSLSEKTGAWIVSSATYIKECIRKIEADPLVGGELHGHKTPLPEGCHPELDKSELLKPDMIQKYQMLLGSAQWAVTLNRLDIAFAVSSLSRFCVTPRLGHLKLALHLFGYLKKNPNRALLMDSRPLRIDEEFNGPSFHPDFLEDYDGATELLDPSLPTPYGDELPSTIFFDADWAHDAVTRRSITGLLSLIGSAPVNYMSKRQGCIATSTYCAEFIAMRAAVEEAISLRYMLRCLGIPVTSPTKLFGDNFGVIQTANVPESEMKRKHVSIAYHFVREAIAAKIIDLHWISSSENFSDICTKSLGSTLHGSIVT